MSRLSSLIFAHELTLDEELVDVPEWGVKLKVQEPTADRRAKLAQQFVDAQEAGGMKLDSFYPALLITCVVDPDDDSAVFTTDDVALINGREGVVVERLAQAALRVAGLTEDAVEVPKEDFSDTPSDEGSSSSQSG